MNDKIEALILQIVPADGSTIGNGRVLECLQKMMPTITKQDYEAVREALADKGVLRRGQGRGGSIALIGTWAARALEATSDDNDAVLDAAEAEADGDDDAGHEDDGDEALDGQDAEDIGGAYSRAAAIFLAQRDSYSLLKLLGRLANAIDDLTCYGALSQFRRVFNCAYQLCVESQDKLSYRQLSEIYRSFSNHLNLLWGLRDEIGPFDDALAECSADLEILKKLADVGENSVEWRYELANRHALIGEIYAEHNEFVDALQHFHACRELRERLANQDKQNIKWFQDLCDIHKEIARIHDKMKDHATAFSEFTVVLNMTMQLYKLGNAADIEKLMSGEHLKRAYQSCDWALRNVTRKMKDDHNPEGALSNLFIKMAINDRLISELPNDTLWQGYLADTHVEIAVVLKEEKDFEGALSHLRTAYAIRERLMTQEPSNSEWVFVFANTHIQLALVEKTRGDFDKALTHFQEALKGYEHLNADAPWEIVYQSSLASCHREIGVLLVDREDIDGALLHYKAELKINELFAAQDFLEYHILMEDYLSDLADTHYRIASIFEARNDVAGTLIHYRAYRDVKARLAALGESIDDGEQEFRLPPIFLTSMLPPPCSE